MLRGLLWLLIVALGLGGAWLWREWDHIGLSGSAPPWQPPPAAASSTPAAGREPCSDRDPLRRAWFGDLHVHTAYSMDAYSRGLLATPEDAYRFARGEVIALGPFDEADRGERRGQLRRPLDFAAVTDHAEWLGEVSVCTTAGSPAFDTTACRAFRGEEATPLSLATLLARPDRLLNLVGVGDRKPEICGPDAVWCREGLKNAWQRTREVTEQYYDRSEDCRFTAFHGYEYSRSPGRSKVHRNVIFRNERVPELPVSSLEETDPLGLWESLDRLCNQAPGDCQALAIPHNPNMSNGRMFRVTWRDLEAGEQRRQAALRARFEPVVEIMQIKGESECKGDMWRVLGSDELCDFEKLRGSGEHAPEDCRDDYGTGAMKGEGCQSRLDFARYALIEGMAEEGRIGVNPYRFGFAGGTDTHNATPGDVGEAQFHGCCAGTDAAAAQRLDLAPGFAGRGAIMRNPGGLMGVWAEENSRDALFDAILRREVFATSGPRIQPRLFAGSDLPADICDGNFAADGYAAGVPMGGVLTGPLARAPVFAAAALADPDGGLLQRLQMVKVWHDSAGNFHQAVTDLAGGPDNGAGVDPASCEVHGPGARQFCVTWTDAGFDPAQRAAWYIRVLENPSCRWSWRQCLALPADQRPAGCESAEVPRVIQERAWSSPVWYVPG